ncbi:unnamed protein product [Arctogadus glacialis]
MPIFRDTSVAQPSEGTTHIVWSGIAELWIGMSKNKHLIMDGGGKAAPQSAAGASIVGGAKHSRTQPWRSL